MKKQLWLIVLFCFSCSVFAAIDVHQFSTPQQAQQYQHLTQILRCPKCQNNNIADSNAIIAADMREKVYQLTIQGDNQQQIIDYMVARYGNFVRYDPPLMASTLILWLAPIIVIIIGILCVIFYAKRNSTTAKTALAPTSLSDEEQKRLKTLLSSLNDEDKS